MTTKKLLLIEDDLILGESLVQRFEIEGVNDCSRCHVFENWKPSKFDHSTTRFALDGKHKNVACEKCHKPTQQGELTIVQYKLNEFKCETCHH